MTKSGLFLFSVICYLKPETQKPVNSKKNIDLQAQALFF